MHAILFRKLASDNVTYYQLYDEKDNFEDSPEFSSFADYDHRKESEYFYIDSDSDIKVEDPSLLNIYTDSDNGLKMVSNETDYMVVFEAFKAKYAIHIARPKNVDEIVGEVNRKVLFQQRTTANLVNQIYLNQIIMSSELPVELKLKQKNNILFHGPLGSGKKSIVEILEKSLDIPYADITISGELKNDLSRIVITF